MYRRNRKNSSNNARLQGLTRRNFMKICTLVPGVALTPVLFPKAAKALAVAPDYIGAIVAVDPNNGAILAMASSPTYGQAQFANGLTEKEWRALNGNPQHPLLNRALSAEYAPGSTYKPIVALGALQDGMIQPDTKFY